MDRIDRAIIDHLRRDARLPNVELAERVGLSPSPCLRRVRRLEDDGVIVGYRAEIDPAALDRGFEVMINVNLTAKDRETFLGFEREVAAFEEVVELRRMFGLPDYFVRAATRDIRSYEAFIADKLGRVPGIASVDSHLTMKHIK
ncbi:Lrp/AsnC family transcriptional regulator [Actinomycetospora chlora]|uniref:Lrp/AsnC family transcriptional regulator n=1 Tax=Actinomycetospora chlora TaxID=663608 RepID=A0ABP9A1C6_9PSEU